MHDLVLALFRNAICLCEVRACLSCFITGDNLSIPLGLFDMICLGFIREGRIVQHVEDMEGRQPQVEASCVFKPPCIVKPRQAASSDLSEVDHLGQTQGKRG
jgi:hypothetical protein